MLKLLPQERRSSFTLKLVQPPLLNGSDPRLVIHCLEDGYTDLPDNLLAVRAVFAAEIVDPGLHHALQHSPQHLGIHKTDKSLKSHPLQAAKLHLGQLLTGDLAQHRPGLRTFHPARDPFKREIQSRDILSVIHKLGDDGIHSRSKLGFTDIAGRS
ncbi:hypothetical protein D3C75_889440 [compost metagenome]